MSRHKNDVLVDIKQADDLLSKNKYKEAESILSGLLHQDTNNPEIYYLLGEALCKQEKFQDAFTSIKIANKLQPNHPRILHLLGWVTFMIGDSLMGKKYMQQALNMMPEDIQILCDLAVLENKAGRYEFAMDYVQRALLLDKNNPIVKEVFKITSMLMEMKKSNSSTVH